MTGDHTDETEFSAAYRRIAVETAARAGFPVDTPVGERLTSLQRLRRVAVRTERTFEGLVDLQQFLVDDDPTVRDAARAGIRQVMYRAYTGDESDRSRVGAHRHWTDRCVQALLARQVDPDRAEPWWREPARQVRARKRIIISALLSASAGAVLIASGHPSMAIPPIVLAAALDIGDGAFARVVHMRDAHLRWLSCIASHGGDMLLLASMAYGVESGTIAAGYAWWLLAGTLVTLLGSLVRTSALQAGYRFWRSPVERYARYLAMLGFCVLAGTGYVSAAVATSTTLLAGFGFSEIWRVVRGMERMPAAQDGGLLFIDADQAVHTVPITDDVGYYTGWPTRNMSTDPEGVGASVRRA